MGYTLTHIVNELMLEQGEGQTNKFARYYQLGVAGLRSFNMDTTGAPKVVELTISDNDTADLPLDYLKYIRIGLCFNGQMYCLGRNNALCLDKPADVCGSPVAHVSYRENYFGWGYSDVTLHYRNGEFTGGLFGIGGDNNSLGYYRIDKQTNQIKFSQLSCTSTVIMEYLSDINTIDEDFEVHPFCVEALKDWICWKLKQRSSKPLGEQQLANEDYKKSSRVMRARFASSTAEEWMACFHSGVKATPKL